MFAYKDGSYYTLFLFLLTFFWNKVLKFISCSDAAYVEQLGIQDPSSFSAADMGFFHNILISYLLLIGIGVFWLLYQSLNNSNNNQNFIQELILSSYPFRSATKFSHSSSLEFGWTLLPTFFSHSFLFLLLVCYILWKTPYENHLLL